MHDKLEAKQKGRKQELLSSTKHTFRVSQCISSVISHTTEARVLNLFLLYAPIRVLSKIV
jgi:hypothetical protein